MSHITTRNAGVRQMLTQRRREMQDDVSGRIRDGRTDRSQQVRDQLEHSDGDIQGDIEVALLQMRAETLSRIDEALHRLDAGEYRFCVECSSQITDQRLRALPFAIRCWTCEERREKGQGRAKQLAQRHGLFPELVSF